MNQIFKVLFWSAVVLIDAALILSDRWCFAIIGTAAIAYIYYLVAPLVISFIERKLSIKFNEKTTLALVSSLIIFLVIVHIIATGNRTFKGRVVDADTKQPLEGAIVVAFWKGERGTPTGGTSRLEDVKEIVTDNKGEWRIRGPKGTGFSDFVPNFYPILTFLTGTYYTEPPRFIIFKPGYCAWPNGFQIASCKEMMVYELKPHGAYSVGEGETIGLPKLTNREERRRNMPSHIYDAGPKNYKEIIGNQKEFIRLLNEEDEFLYPGRRRSLYKELLKEIRQH